jgi:hypothetical protein
LNPRTLARHALSRSATDRSRPSGTEHHAGREGLALAARTSAAASNCNHECSHKLINSDAALGAWLNGAQAEGSCRHEDALVASLNGLAVSRPQVRLFVMFVHRS